MLLRNAVDRDGTGEEQRGQDREQTDRLPTHGCENV